MSGLNSALSDRMGYQEEVKGSINDLWLFYESIVNICTLRRVSDGSITTSTFLAIHLEESLSYSFVNNNQGYFRHFYFSFAIFLLFFFIASKRIFLSNNFVELFKLMLNYLLSHGVAYTIPVDEDMIG